MLEKGHSVILSHWCSKSPVKSNVLKLKVHPSLTSRKGYSATSASNPVVPFPQSATQIVPYREPKYFYLLPRQTLSDSTVSQTLPSFHHSLALCTSTTHTILLSPSIHRHEPPQPLTLRPFKPTPSVSLSLYIYRSKTRPPTAHLITYRPSPHTRIWAHLRYTGPSILKFAASIACREGGIAERQNTVTMHREDFRANSFERFDIIPIAYSSWILVAHRFDNPRRYVLFFQHTKYEGFLRLQLYSFFLLRSQSIRLTIRTFYAYQLFQRSTQFNAILQGGRFFQQCPATNVGKLSLGAWNTCNKINLRYALPTTRLLLNNLGSLEVMKPKWRLLGPTVRAFYHQTISAVIVTCNKTFTTPLLVQTKLTI